MRRIFVYIVLSLIICLNVGAQKSEGHKEALIKMDKALSSTNLNSYEIVFKGSSFKQSLVLQSGKNYELAYYSPTNSLAELELYDNEDCLTKGLKRKKRGDINYISFTISEPGVHHIFADGKEGEQLFISLRVVSDSDNNALSEIKKNINAKSLKEFNIDFSDKKEFTSYLKLKNNKSYYIAYYLKPGEAEPSINLFTNKGISYQNYFQWKKEGNVRYTLFNGLSSKNDFLLVTTNGQKNLSLIVFEKEDLKRINTHVHNERVDKIVSNFKAKYLKDFYLVGKTYKQTFVLAKNTTYRISYAYEGEKDQNTIVKIYGNNDELMQDKLEVRNGIKSFLLHCNKTGVYHIYAELGEEVRDLTVVLSFEGENKKGKKLRVKDKIYDAEDIFFIVENMPRFKRGGTKSFREWLSDNVVYPNEAIKNREEGKVFVQMVVNEKGEVTNPRIVRGVSRALDKAALDLVKSSPKWTPGVHEGVPVKVAFTFPIVYKLIH